VKIILTQNQAKDLSYDVNPEVVRACLYLGYGMLQTAKLASSPLRREEAAGIVQMAADLGISESDEIIVLER